MATTVDLWHCQRCSVGPRGALLHPIAFALLAIFRICDVSTVVGFARVFHAKWVAFLFVPVSAAADAGCTLPSLALWQPRGGPGRSDCALDSSACCTRTAGLPHRRHCLTSDSLSLLSPSHFISLSLSPPPPRPLPSPFLSRRRCARALALVP